MSRAAANQLLARVIDGGQATETEILFALLATGDLVVCPLGQAEKGAHLE